jgi:hypothetical protein
VQQVRQLDRLAVRAHVEKHFSASRMVDDYLNLYRRVLGQTEVAAPIRSRRARPLGARCDACHERKQRVQRSRDGLLTLCATCARGVDLRLTDATEALAAVVSRAPAVERRKLARRLHARQLIHAARGERRARLEESHRAG